MSYQKVPSDEHDVESPGPQTPANNYVSAWTIFNTALKCLTCILLLLCSTLLAINISITSRNALQTCSSTDVFTTPHVYGSNHRYMSLLPSYDIYWQTELTSHSTMIALGTHPDGFEEHGAITMFHQLHCLAMIRETLQRASSGVFIGRDETDGEHWPHCLHYIREQILCFADDTIERGVIINGSRTNGIEGAREMRMCRDPAPLYAKRKTDGLEGFKGVDHILDW